MPIGKIIETLTLEQKCALLSGGDTFKTRAVAGIPQMWLSDGPHGVRKQAGASDHLGLNPSEPATCFPTAATVANSWDPALGEEIGKALGEEAATQGVGVLLGPGLNIKRNPLCGRNFEYFSEDPYLAGQDGRRVCAGHSVKRHFGVPQAFRGQQSRDPPHGSGFHCG
ncbi:glycoside hydrolase family 3 N-terminal domain-containing protein [Gemmiger formicilis]|uniref:glycoside hydrolase family 3 N-terminal domain-containing protein n=1 Tax=Gemmiger formicilis TaxID=745368 RepID=UPI00352215CD